MPAPSTPRSRSRKPLFWRGLRHPSAVLGMPTTTRWPRPPSDCSRPKRSGRVARFGPGLCAPSTTSSTRRWNGSTGTTTAACTASWTTSRRANTGAPTTLNSGRPSRRCLKHEAGIKPGTVQSPVRSVYEQCADSCRGCGTGGGHPFETQRSPQTGDPRPSTIGAVWRCCVAAAFLAPPSTRVNQRLPMRS